MEHVHLYAPKPMRKAVHARVCPDCKKWTRMLCVFTPWYGWDTTCIRCGRMWIDGEWLPLDFCRGVRKQNVERAKARFRSCPNMTIEEMLAAS